MPSEYYDEDDNYYWFSTGASTAGLYKFVTVAPPKPKVKKLVSVTVECKLNRKEE